MDRLNFYVDEANLATAAASIKDNAELLETIVETMESIIDCKEICRLYCFDEFYSLQVKGDDIAQLIFGNINDGNVRDLLVRLQIVLGETEATRVNNATSTGAVALQSQNAGGWISIDSPCANAWWNSNAMFWLASKSQTISALRNLFVFHCLPHPLLDKFAKFLFPNIYFYEQPSEIKNTSLDYATILSLYVQHLSYLNDHAYQDFANEVQPKVLIANAGSRGIVMSPESPQTHKNKDAMKERDISIGEISICCEWHTKLDNTRGRIHFYPWQHKDATVQKIAGKRVIVGIIVEHLT